MPSPRRLLSFEFASLCLIAFLAIANATAYYNLFGHLAELGVPAGLRGLVVGAYALVAVGLYLVASPFLTIRNAPRAMLAGIAILAAYGIVPAGMDLLVPHLPSVATGHALSALVLLPAVGLGLGAGHPALNGLMFELPVPRLRPQNANLMMFGARRNPRRAAVRRARGSPALSSRAWPPPPTRRG